MRGQPDSPGPVGPEDPEGKEPNRPSYQLKGLEELLISPQCYT